MGREKQEHVTAFVWFLWRLRWSSFTGEGRGGLGGWVAGSYFWVWCLTVPLETHDNRACRNHTTCIWKNVRILFPFNSRCSLQIGVFWRKSGDGGVNRCSRTPGKLNLHFNWARTRRGFCTKQAEITPSSDFLLRLNLESLDDVLIFDSPDRASVKTRHQSTRAHAATKQTQQAR